MNKTDITDSTVNILLEIDGQLYITRFEKEKHEAMEMLIKSTLHDVIKIDKTQKDLLEFIGWGDENE